MKYLNIQNHSLPGHVKKLALQDGTATILQAQFNPLLTNSN